MVFSPCGKVAPPRAIAIVSRFLSHSLQRHPPRETFDSPSLAHTSQYTPHLPQVLDFTVLAATPALRHLDVSHNLLYRMEPLDGRDLPHRLETLNMSHNRVSKIGGIAHCFVLRVLDLSHNHIKVCIFQQ